MLLSDLKRKQKIQINACLYLFLDNIAQKTCNTLHESDSLIIPLCRKRNEILTRTYDDPFWRAQCCNELSLSGTLAPEWGSLKYWDLRSSSFGLCTGKAPLASYKCYASRSCPLLIWELRRQDFVTSRWQLGLYPWVFWSIKLSLVNTVSGFLRETNALEKKKNVLYSPSPKSHVFL